MLRVYASAVLLKILAKAVYSNSCNGFNELARDNLANPKHILLTPRSPFTDLIRLPNMALDKKHYLDQE
jgi:hypothetical protein